MAGTIYHAYCDESCTDKGHSHMVLAGILSTAENALDFRDHMREWRVRTNMTKELKWTRVSSGRLLHYRDYVSNGLQRIHSQAFAFRSLVIKKSELDYAHYHDGDEEKAFRRFIYTLVFHCFCPMIGDDDQLALFLDQRDGACLEELRTILNRTLRNQRRFRKDLIRSASWIDSKKSEMMQFNDVLMGAVGCHNNSRHLSAGTRAAKVEVAAAIASAVGLRDLTEGTPRWAKHFGIWHLDLSKKRRRPLP